MFGGSAEALLMAMVNTRQISAKELERCQKLQRRNNSKQQQKEQEKRYRTAPDRLPHQRNLADSPACRGSVALIRIGKFGPRIQHCHLAGRPGSRRRVAAPWSSSRRPPVTQTACTNCGVDSTPPSGREAFLAPPSLPSLSSRILNYRKSSSPFGMPRCGCLQWRQIGSVGMYFAILLFSLYRILVSWRRARQLVIDAEPAVLSPQWNAILQDSGRRLGTRLPQLRKSADVRSPVIVGVMHPVLLLPEDFDDHSRTKWRLLFFTTSRTSAVTTTWAISSANWQLCPWPGIR